MSLTLLEIWLALTLVPGLGARGCARLCRAYADPRTVLTAAPEDLCQKAGIRLPVAREIAGFSAWDAVARERETATRLGFELIPLGDERYPERLFNIYDPPPILYCRGRLPTDDRPVIAVVGSRRATAHGRRFAFRLAGELARRGVAVVSGMALGIDAEAHAGCLAENGLTVAVMGSGLDVVYPARHHRLADDIARDGAVLSELPLGTRPEPGNFPRRNRLISGLADGVVVVEASRKSGTLITARCALDQGREVFAVPGLPGSPSVQGTHWLLKEGAQLVERADDIFAAFPRWSTSAPASVPPAGGRPAPTPEQCRLAAILADGPRSVDDLIEVLDWDHATLSARLLEMELGGGVFRDDSGRYNVDQAWLRS
ncbi:MAG: DNA-processing protein DprA [Deltaproteobacteria bacterium]|nr:DNA-processing protein DprA [Candidatus Anaeroferrophillacea bacterium]